MNFHRECDVCGQNKHSTVSRIFLYTLCKKCDYMSTHNFHMHKFDNNTRSNSFIRNYARKILRFEINRIKRYKYLLSECNKHDVKWMIHDIMDD